MITTERYTIKQARRLSEKTQVEMAQLLGISRDTYRKIELNPDSATIAQARAISLILKIPVNQIFALVDADGAMK